MMKYCIMGLMVLAIAGTSLAGSSDPNLPHDQVFTGVIGDNWNVANNWYELEVPDGNHAIYVGCPEYPNKSAVIYTNTTALNGHTYIGVGAGVSGSLLIQAGATLSPGSIEVGAFDNDFTAGYLPFDITDDNEWVIGGTGTLTVNGTISTDGRLQVAPEVGSDGTVHLNAGGVIEMTGTGGDGYFGQNFHYDWGGYYEFYQADGTTLSIADNFHFNEGPNHPNSFYKMSGGTILFGQDNAGLGYGRVYNGTFWVDGGTGTIIPGGATSADWGMFAFVTYTWPGDDDGNTPGQTPTLKFGGANPLLKVKGNLVFAAGLLDVDADTISIAGWDWVTVAEANFIGTFTDWEKAGANGYGDGNDLTFAPSVDANIWSMRVLDNKVDIMVSKRGDMDKDSKYTVDDINPFVMALTDPNAYLLAYGIDPNLIGDCDYSGKLDTDDISPFVALITGGASAVPEPACIGVIALGAAAFIRRRRR